MLCCFFVTTIGWFAWNAFLSGVFAATPSGTYAIHGTFTNFWGRDAYWWLTLFVVLAIMGLMELFMKAVKRNLVISGMWKWPPWNRRRIDNNAEEWDVELWQEMEQDPEIWERFKRLARNEELDGTASADDEHLELHG